MSPCPPYDRRPWTYKLSASWCKLAFADNLQTMLLQLHCAVRTDRQYQEKYDRRTDRQDATSEFELRSVYVRRALHGILN